jgi:hypothetical protein
LAGASALDWARRAREGGRLPRTGRCGCSIASILLIRSILKRRETIRKGISVSGSDEPRVRRGRPASDPLGGSKTAVTSSPVQPNPTLDFRGLATPSSDSGRRRPDWPALAANWRAQAGPDSGRPPNVGRNDAALELNRLQHMTTDPHRDHRRSLRGDQGVASHSGKPSPAESGRPLLGLSAH